MDIIEKLKAERTELEHRIAKIDELIQEFQAWQARVSSVVGDAIADQQIATEQPQVGEPPRDERPVTPMREFEAAVFDVLSEADHPLNRTELLERLQSMGIVVGGSEPRNTLSARMTRMSDRVTNIRGHGYAFKGRFVELTGDNRDGDLLIDEKAQPQEAGSEHKDIFG